MIIAFLAVLGLCFGSFVNAFVWRLHQHKDWVKARSICPECKHVLAAADLVPVLSWLTLGAKCRYCKKPISWQYPLVELATAAAFVVSYLYWPRPFDTGGILSLGVWLFLLIGLMTLVVYDFKWMLLPNKLVYPMIIIAACSVAADAVFFGGGTQAVKGAVFGLLTAAVPFYLLFQLSSGRWIGGGDVKLGMLIGLLVNGAWEGLAVIFMASVLGVVWALPGMLRHRVRPSSRIPFGPFLILGLFIVKLFGASMISWYLNTVMMMPA